MTCETYRAVLRLHASLIYPNLVSPWFCAKCRLSQTPPAGEVLLEALRLALLDRVAMSLAAEQAAQSLPPPSSGR